MRGKKKRKGKGQVAERYRDKSATDSHHLLCCLLAFMLFQFQSAALSLVFAEQRACSLCENIRIWHYKDFKHIKMIQLSAS